MGNIVSQIDGEDDAWMPLATKGERDATISQVHSLLAQKQSKGTSAFMYEVPDKTKFQRFLILGSDNSLSYKTYSVEPKRENAQCIDRLISQGLGKDVVDIIETISTDGRAAKQQPTIFALAVCARSNDVETKRAAYKILNTVCRIPTHLFMFIKYCEEESSGTGWGRAHRTAITNWYKNKCKHPIKAGRLITKYKKREGWTHKDVLRLVHMKPEDNAANVIVRFVIKGFKEAKILVQEAQMDSDQEIMSLYKFLEATDMAKHCTNEMEMVELIRNHCLEREHLPTQLLNSKPVWEALVKNLRIEAKIRNLGKITSMGLCDEGSDTEHEIVKALTNEKQLKDARVHPFKILLALYVYRNGAGEKGSLHWKPNERILSALDQAFYMSFKSVEPTKKRYLLAVDVSGSMAIPCVGSQVISCRDAAAAMMMVTVRTEDTYDVVAFSHKLTPLQINKNDTLNEVIQTVSNLPFGGTDCALPMLWAAEHKKSYDVFMIYTDSETWFGRTHPSRALLDYRDTMKIHNAKLIVVGMASNGFSIADPEDIGMLDIVGFDSGATQIIAGFCKDQV